MEPPDLFTFSLSTFTASENAIVLLVFSRTAVEMKSRFLKIMNRLICITKIRAIESPLLRLVVWKDMKMLHANQSSGNIYDLFIYQKAFLTFPAVVLIAKALKN